MLMVKKGNQSILDLLYTRGDFDIPDFNPYRQGVQEHAEGTLSGFTALHSAQQHRAEHHVIPRPVRQASTCAHARWNRLAGLVCR